jgi:hypothetical protein
MLSPAVRKLLKRAHSIVDGSVYLVFPSGSVRGSSRSKAPRSVPLRSQSISPDLTKYAHLRMSPGARHELERTSFMLSFDVGMFSSGGKVHRFAPYSSYIHTASTRYMGRGMYGMPIKSCDNSVSAYARMTLSYPPWLTISEKETPSLRRTLITVCCTWTSAGEVGLLTELSCGNSSRDQTGVVLLNITYTQMYSPQTHCFLGKTSLQLFVHGIRDSEVILQWQNAECQ